MWASKIARVARVQTRTLCTYKTSTGLVGLAVDTNGLDTVHKLSLEVLENVKVVIIIILYTYTTTVQLIINLIIALLYK